VAREVLDQNGISGRKVVLAELRGVDPCKLCAANGLGLTAADAAAKETDTDDFFGVGVFDLAEESADIDFESELFAQFAGKAGFPGFTPLAFPAREFPEAAQVLVRKPPGDQKPALAEDQSGGDLDGDHRPMLL